MKHSLPQAVKKLRAALGLTQPAFARRLALSVRSVANYEKDRTPTGEILQRFYILAAKHGLSDLAMVFSDALHSEFIGRTAPATAEESAYVQALLILLRTRDELGLEELSAELLEKLENLARKIEFVEHGSQGELEKALTELRYHAAPNAEKKIEELAKALSKRTGQPFEKCYAQTVYERPDLYAAYLEDRAAAAKGTSYEASMTAAPRRRRRETK